MKPIRLAMLRCDTHGYWYAPFLARCDPLKFQAANPVCHHFFANMYRPDEFIIPREPGFRLVKVWDEDPDRARVFSETFTDAPQVCRQPEDMAEGVDAAFIACCSLDGSDHPRLTRPFLEQGIPTFVDKPFAATLRDAKAMIRLAEEHGAPIMSASLLSLTDQVPQMLRRAGEIGPMMTGVVKGCNGWLTRSGLEGISHGVAMALATFGHGPDWVECIGELPQEIILMHYPDGRKIIVLNMDGECFGGPFVVEVWGRRDPKINTPTRTNLQSRGIGDPEFLTIGPKIAKLFKKMVRTRKPPIPYDKILEWVRIIAAAGRAQRSGKRVYMRQVQ